MNPLARRYIFIDYENLLLINFKKLEKVASRVFVFVDTAIEKIPLSLVAQTQAAGKNLRWIIVKGATPGNLDLYIAFIMGKLHEKLEKDVEFAIVSNNSELDPLVEFINAEERSCIRVKRKKDVDIDHLESNINFEGERRHNGNSHISSFSDDNAEISVMEDDAILAMVAEETIKRMIRSGNRPADVSTLKSYILLHNQELSFNGDAESIIQKMLESKNIEINKEEVTYNF